MITAPQYKQKIVKYYPQPQFQKTLYFPNRLVKFILPKQNISKHNQTPTPPKSPPHRPPTITKGILKNKMQTITNNTIREFGTAGRSETVQQPAIQANEQSDRVSPAEQQCWNLHCNSKMRAQFNNYQSNITKFEDEQFQRNFYISPKIFQQQAKDLASRIVWRRISDLFPPKTHQLMLFQCEKSNSFNLISKGSELCPNYMIQSLNSLRFNRQVLSMMFGDQKYNQKGIYYVNLFKQDKWQTVIIDDYIPVLPRKTRFKFPKDSAEYAYKPVFTYISAGKSRSNSRKVQIWHYLLEKAYAKLYGSYEAILSGSCFDFFWDTTGQHSESFLTKMKEIDWQNLNEGFFGIGLTEKLHKIPLSFHPGKDKVSFVSPTDSHYKQTIWPQDIPFFFPYLYGWNRKTYEYWGSIRIPSNQSDQVQMVTFEFKTSAPYCLTLVQKDNRLYRQYEQYCWMRLILLQRQSSGDYRWINGKYSNSRILAIDGNLSKGQYHVLILPEWKKMKNGFSVVLKTRNPTVLRNPKYEELCFEKGCSDLAQRFGYLNQLNKNICSYNCIHEKMGMIIEDIFNQKITAKIRVKRMLIDLKKVLSASSPQSQVYLKGFNRQFNEQQGLEVDIPGSNSYTVAILMKGGINHQFFENLSKKSILK